MSFQDAIATQPQWIQLWLNFMGLVIAGTIITLLFSRATRKDALIVLLVMALTFPAMLWLYSKVGYVRLLGIIHVVFWTPLAIYLWKRLSDPEITTPFRQIIWLFLATVAVSLAIDYTDVIRYALGERASMIPAT